MGVSIVEIYTDGACKGNPGPGGFGIVMMYGSKRKEFYEAYKHTTNNRMELLSVITALEKLKRPCHVNLTTDSRYVVEAINNRWVYGWMRKGWRNTSGNVPNVDLWERLIKLLELHGVRFIWVRGHNNNTENERCDLLANKAIVECEPKDDTGYRK